MHYLAFGKFSFQIWKWIGIFFVKYGHILIFKLPLYFCQKTETYQTSWKPRLDSCIPSRRINTCKSKNAEKQCLQYFANRGRDLQDSWGGKGCLESASSTVLLTAGSVRSGWSGCGPAGFWESPRLETQQCLWWPVEKNFLHCLAAVSLSIERKQAIERDFIALKCCYVRYSTFCVSVNNVNGIVVFLSLWQTNEIYIL